MLLRLLLAIAHSIVPLVDNAQQWLLWLVWAQYQSINLSVAQCIALSNHVMGRNSPVCAQLIKEQAGKHGVDAKARRETQRALTIWSEILDTCI